MRRLIAITLTALSLVLASPLSAGELIDGVVATVNRRPILRSEWDEAVRFEAFLHQKALSQVSESEKTAALQRLIDRHLLAAQMEGQTALRPAQPEVSADIVKLREKFGVATDNPKWQASMHSYGLTEDEVAAHLRDEVQVMNFIDVQLRPNVRVLDAEIQAYYQSRVLPDLKQNGAKEVALEQVAPGIRELLAQQHMDEMLDAWLHNLRQQSHIQTLIPLPTINAELGSGSAGGGK
jgi:hypothetical protein